MDALRREEIEAQAMLLLRSHFDFLSEGRLEEAKKQLLWPSGAPGKPEQIYVETMGRTAPQDKTRGPRRDHMDRRCRGVLSGRAVDVYCRMVVS